MFIESGIALLWSNFLFPALPFYFATDLGTVTEIFISIQ